MEIVTAVAAAVPRGGPPRAGRAVGMRLLALPVLLLALSGPGAYAAPAGDGDRQGSNDARALLWSAEKAAQRLYLLGSIHFGDETLYPMPPAVEAAYADADTLAVEIDIEGADAGKAAQLMLVRGMYPDVENNLRTHVEARTWDLLVERAPRYGLPIEFLQQQKPWLATVTLSAMAARAAGLREDLGIDVHFLQRARRDGKPIVALESVELQFGMFEDLSAAEQDAFLFQTLSDLEDAPGYFRRMLEAWRDGDGAALNEQVNESLRGQRGLERVHRSLLIDRNIAMARKIDALAEQGKVPLVVVGAGHMVGEQGLVDLLRGQGYTVTQH